MTAGKSRRPDGGKRGGGRTKGNAPESEARKRQGSGHTFVDVDPWAVLLEQLMEVPDEEHPAERKGGKGKREHRSVEIEDAESPARRRG